MAARYLRKLGYTSGSEETEDETEYASADKVENEDQDQDVTIVAPSASGDLSLKALVDILLWLQLQQKKRAEELRKEDQMTNVKPKTYIFQVAKLLHYNWFHVCDIKGKKTVVVFPHAEMSIYLSV